MNLLVPLEQLIQRFDAPGVHALVLMGSYARGEAGPFSDIDVVRFTDETEQTGAGRIPHADEITAMLGIEWKEKDHMRLTIELVPQPCWNSNLRSKMTRANWDHLRTLVYATYNDRCGICHARQRLYTTILSIIA